MPKASHGWIEIDLKDGTPDFVGPAPLGTTALRYFDPSYQIRGCPANTEDALLCDRLGDHAVHAAMAGKTGLIISFLNGQFVHVPIDLIAQGSKRLDLDGELWRAVRSSTGQPAQFE